MKFFQKSLTKYSIFQTSTDNWIYHPVFLSWSPGPLLRPGLVKLSRLFRLFYDLVNDQKCEKTWGKLSLGWLATVFSRITGYKSIRGYILIAGYKSSTCVNFFRCFRCKKSWIIIENPIFIWKYSEILTKMPPPGPGLVLQKFLPWFRSWDHQLSIEPNMNEIGHGQSHPNRLHPDGQSADKSVFF
jgi:hypothetical protein